jgi:N-methylhydantoinase A/oxoprolinase/acetone carboxylase beta subunit
MWKQLSGTGDELRDCGYQKPLMMVHNSGGMAEIFHTATIQTYNGGPAAGLIGGAHLGKIQGFKNVVVSDMGGTSFDLAQLSQEALVSTRSDRSSSRYTVSKVPKTK